MIARPDPNGDPGAVGQRGANFTQQNADCLITIGGCIASKRKRTVLIEGDGGFAMNLQELETVTRLKLPLKIFVLNNQGYGSIRATQKNYFSGRLFASCETGGLTLPNWERVARCFSLPFHQLANHVNLRAGLADILNTPGPVLTEVMVSPDQVTAPRVASRPTPDGGMESAPMEDMSPLLERQEFLDNMKRNQSVEKSS
ncbi:MAG: thiamine pyrophosphate-dependent enzyme [Dissulfuribacterales bacterium]